MHRIKIFLLLEDGRTDTDYDSILTLCEESCGVKVLSDDYSNGSKTYNWCIAMIGNDVGREYCTEEILADETYSKAVSKLKKTLGKISNEYGLLKFNIGI